MIAELAKYLWTDMQSGSIAGLEDFTIVVTGDHSTTVCSGDHSFEPVPFVICKLSRAMAVERDVTDIATERREEPAEMEGGKGEESTGLGWRSLRATTFAQPPSSASSALPRKADGDALQDTVSHFSEVDAHAGALGRFSGSEVMELIKGFADFAS